MVTAKENHERCQFRVEKGRGKGRGEGEERGGDGPKTEVMALTMAERKSTMRCINAIRPFPMAAKLSRRQGQVSALFEVR